MVCPEVHCAFPCGSPDGVPRRWSPRVRNQKPRRALPDSGKNVKESKLIPFRASGLGGEIVIMSGNGGSKIQRKIPKFPIPNHANIIV